MIVSHLNGYKSDELPYATDIRIKEREEAQPVHASVVTINAGTDNNSG